VDFVIPCEFVELVDSLWNACEACGNCDELTSLLMQVTRMEGMLGVIAMTKGSCRTKRGKVFLFTEEHNLNQPYFHQSVAGALPPPPAALVPAQAVSSELPIPAAAYHHCSTLPPPSESFASMSGAALPAMAPTAVKPVIPMAAAAPNVRANPAPVAAISGPLDMQLHQQCWDKLTARFKDEKLRQHTWE
jgi:hypothetical protein